MNRIVYIHVNLYAHYHDLVWHCWLHLLYSTETNIPGLVLCEQP